MPIRSPTPTGFLEPPPTDDDRRERSERPERRLPPPRSGPPPTVPPTTDFVGGARAPLALVPDKRRRDKRTTDPHDPIVPQSPRRVARPAPPRPASPPPDIDVPGVGSGASVTAPRRLALPRPVTVTAAADDGRPLRVSGRAIDSVRESWLIEDRWWTGNPLRRRYWEVVTTCGRNVVVFHDLVDGRWFSQRG